MDSRTNKTCYCTEETLMWSGRYHTNLNQVGFHCLTLDFAPGPQEVPFPASTHFYLGELRQQKLHCLKTKAFTLFRCDHLQVTTHLPQQYITSCHLRASVNLSVLVSLQTDETGKKNNQRVVCFTVPSLLNLGIPFTVFPPLNANRHVTKTTDIQIYIGSREIKKNAVDQVT